MRKKLISLALGLSVMAAAVGCSSKPKETEKATEAKTEAKTEAVASTEEEAAPETEAATEAAEAATEAAAVEETITEAAKAVEEAVTEAAEVVTEAAEVETEAAEAATEAAEAETEAAEPATEAAEAETEAAEATTEAAEEETEAAEVVTEAAEVETEAAEVVTEAPEVETEAAAPQGEGIEEGTADVITAGNLSEHAAPQTKVVPKETEAAEEAEAVTEAAEAVSEAAEEADEDAFQVKVALDETPIEGTVDDFDITDNDVVILYTNDVHGGISADDEYSGSELSLGYAGLAGVKADVTERAADTLLVGNGDDIQGSVVTTESDGMDAAALMSMVGYDIQIPGNHDFDYGMDNFMAYATSVDGDFICCNFVTLEDDEPIFDPYTLRTFEVNGEEFTVGFVGMSTPESITKSTPTFFQDDEGNYIYGFTGDNEKLYAVIQKAIDSCYEDGADFVIGMGHMGDTGVQKGWSSIDVIENTTGMNAFLDAHAHSVIPGEVVQNKDGEDVLLTSTGTKLEHIGLMKMDVAEDGTITLSTGLVNEITDEEKETYEYNELYDAVQAIEDSYAYLFVEEGKSDFELVINDPKTGERIVRNTETNLGDFLADVYLNYFDADVAIINGGSIRANIDAGDIVFMDLVTIYPWNTATGVVEVTGQQILDCLEMGARLYPEECGGWIQPAGMTYMIDSTIDSSVNVNSDGEFVSVDGEYRVKNVMVGDEPLDLDKLYKLAVNEYYSKDYGDGMTMFKGCKVLVPAPGELPIIDHDVVDDYIRNTLHGQIPAEYKDPYGQGRITIITEENKDLLEAAEEEAVTENVEAAEEETDAENEQRENRPRKQRPVVEALTEAETE